jgi:hypothetical protein
VIILDTLLVGGLTGRGRGAVRAAFPGRPIRLVPGALLRLERAIRALARRFGLTPEDLTLDLGPVA